MRSLRVFILFYPFSANTYCHADHTTGAAGLLKQLLSGLAACDVIGLSSVGERECVGWSLVVKVKAVKVCLCAAK